MHFTFRTSNAAHQAVQFQNATNVLGYHAAAPTAILTLNAAISFTQMTNSSRRYGFWINGRRGYYSHPEYFRHCRRHPQKPSMTTLWELTGSSKLRGNIHDSSQCKKEITLAVWQCFVHFAYTSKSERWHMKVAATVREPRTSVVTTAERTEPYRSLRWNRWGRLR